MEISIKVCPLLIQTLSNKPQLEDKIKEFRKLKSNNPLARFGKTDYPFKAGYLRGYSHAHLTGDISIIYKLSGSNPRILYLYGVFSHEELGTGNPPKNSKQKQISTRLSNQDDKFK